MGNAPSSVPNYGQVSQVRFPIDCTNAADGSVLSQDFTFSATAPLAAGAYYLSDVRASLPYPGTIQGGKLTVDIAFSNASPSDLLASDTTFGSSTLQIPGSDISDLGPVPNPPVTIGPVKINGPVSRYSVTGVSYIVIDNSNKQSNYTCSVRQNIVGSVTNDGTAPSALPAADVPSAPSGSKASVVNLPIVCADGTPYGLQMQGIEPLQPSELFQITDFVFYFKIPASKVAEVKARTGQNQVQVGFLLGQDEVGGSPAGLGFNLTNASPALFDLATGAYTAQDGNTPKSLIASYKTTGGNLSVAFPLDRTLAFNPFQITSGGIFSASPLGAYGLFADQSLTVVEQISCAVSPAVEIFAGPIP